MTRFGTLALAATAGLALQATAATAQVAPEMKAKIAEIGRIVDPPSTAALYGPLQPKAPYAGVTVARDIKYGPDPRNILDVFTVSNTGSRPVLIFVPGGAGNKIEPVPQGEAFYDNVMLWATKNGMVGVNMQRHSEFMPWDLSARDIAQTVDWVKKNIARYGGDPNRVFIWGHSAGAMNLSVYLSHPELYPQGGVGVKAAVLMAGPYNLAPLQGKAPPIRLRLQPGGPVVGIDAIAAPPAGAAPAGPPPNPADPRNGAVLPGLRALDIPLYVNAAELDPEALVESAQMLKDQLCAAGKCPKFDIFKDHGHMSEIFAVNTSDVSTSAPVLEFLRAVR